MQAEKKSKGLFSMVSNLFSSKSTSIPPPQPSINSSARSFNFCQEDLSIPQSYPSMSQEKCAAFDCGDMMEDCLDVEEECEEDSNNSF